MFFKKMRQNSDNDAIGLLKYALLGLLLILTPVTLFLTAFAWYGSLQYHKSSNPDLLELELYLKNGLIFGSIGLISFLLYLGIFMAIDLALKKVEYQWKKVILLLAIALSTIFFLLVEIFSAIFINYLYNWEMSLVLTFWPIIYILLLTLLLVDYFEFYNDWKNNKLEKRSVSIKDVDDMIQDHHGIMA